MQTTYEVKGMSCEGCVRSVKSAIAAVLPSAEAEASVQNATVTVSGEHDPKLVKQAVEDAGFTFGGAKG